MDNIRGWELSDYFRKIHTIDLQGSVTAVAQCLDDQWFPDMWLDKAFESPGDIKRIMYYRDQKARAEYIRSLIIIDKLIVNRAYLYNSSIVYRDYIQDKNDSKASFLILLRDGVIIPYLYNESYPTAPPKFPTAEFEAWKGICYETEIFGQPMSCLRYHWEN